EGTVMQDVYVVIDSRNNLYDTNRGNNTAHSSLLRAELELSDMTYYQITQSDVPDEEMMYSEYKVTAQVKNIGCIPVNSAEVSLFENDANGLLVDTASVSSLEPGDVKAVEFVWDSSGKTFENDRFNLAAEVKSDGVEEYSLDNNVFYKAVKAEMLTIKRSEPSDDESDVPINSHVTLEFNKSIFEGDRYSEIIFIDSKGNEVPAAKEINEFQLTLKPDAALVNGETYAVYVPVDSVNGYDGSGLRDDYSLAFTTEQLYTSPVVKFVYPADGMTDIPRDSNINIRFSGTIIVGSQYEGIVIRDDKRNIVNAKKTIQRELLSLKPNAVLGPDTTYMVMIPAGAVAYTDGTLMENDYIFSFTTDATAPDPDPDPDPDPTPAPPPSSDHPVSPVKREDGSSETVSTGLKTEDGKDIVLSKNQRELGEKASLLAEEKGVRVMTNPVEFIAQAVAADGSKTEFEDKQTYIPREIQLEGDIDPTKATAVLYNPETGTMVPVPTVFTKKDGKTTAIINHYGSGIYMVISSGKGFEDVQEHWAKEEIETLASKLITDGAGNDRYDPQAQLTKAQFATLIVRALGMSASKPVGQSAFSDVADQWFTDTINIAVEAGIIDESESVFRPNDAITREEIAVMIKNAVAAIGKSVKLDNVDELIGRFADYDNVKAESKDAIAALIEMGVISGNEKGEINPGDDATRAEAAAMIIRFLRYLGFMN
ncbi:MAG: S-layer homology domain-containing protein, partial [Synergistaceae bacterium]|nr:S-layer homology domain-containing protein [Synergistaceae bacterium]